MTWFGLGEFLHNFLGPTWEVEGTKTIPNMYGKKHRQKCLRWTADFLYDLGADAKEIMEVEYSVHPNIKFFFYYESMNYNFHVPSLKLTFSPLKRMVAIRSCPSGPALFSGANCEFWGGGYFSCTLQENNISHLWKRRTISLTTFGWGYVSFQEGTFSSSFFMDVVCIG